MQTIIIKNNNYAQVQDLIKKRSCFDLDIRKVVNKIIENVKNNGDDAVLKYTNKFDKVKLTQDKLLVSKKEFDEAEKLISSEIKTTIEFAKNNISRFHSEFKKQGMQKDFEPGVSLGSLVRPLSRVGIYIPGGTAPLLSTVLMTVIPAKTAGVSEIIVVSPPDKHGKINPNILFACKFCGVDKVFKVGGAQAIAAMAFGTDTIPKADKIVGPGNIYVTTAKKEVYGYVDIDMAAGPSEIMVVADETVDPVWTAYDLMSQAEHDKMASSFLACFSQEYANKVEEEFNKILKNMPKQDIIKSSWENNSAIFIVDDKKQAVDIINIIAPEHLELMIDNAKDWLADIKNAGAVFLGKYTPEAIGDYVAGPSHVLPTTGSARYFSGLNVSDFYKSMSVISYEKQAFLKHASYASKLAELEGLMAHRGSVECRKEIAQ